MSVHEDAVSSGGSLTASAVKEDIDSLVRAIAALHPSPFRIHPRNAWLERWDTLEAPATAYADLYAGILATLALGRDGHFDAYPAESFRSVRAAVPVKFVDFPEGLHVVAAAPRYAGLVGSRVVAIEGVRTSLVLSRLRSLVPSDNEWGTRELLEDYVRMPALLHAVGANDMQAGLQLTVWRDGRTAAVTIGHGDVSEALPVGPPRRATPPGWVDAREATGAPAPLWQCCLDQPLWWERLPELGALYVQLNRMAEDEEGTFARFAAALPRPEASGLARLIVDLRTNRGGDANLAQPLLRAILRHWRSDEPGIVFVLISNYTFSAAVHLAADLERLTHATFVGEATAAPPNHYGDVRVVTLPHSGIAVEIPTLYWQKSDPRDARLAISPDIVAPLTWEVFLAGRDPGLEAIAALPRDDHRLARDWDPIVNWARATQGSR